MKTTNLNQDKESADTIKAEIEETRNRIGQQVEAVAEKLNPSALAENAREWAHDTMENIDLEKAKEKVEKNAIPLAFLGLAVGSFFAGNWYRNRQSRKGEPSEDVFERSDTWNSTETPSLSTVDPWAHLHESPIHSHHRQSNGSNDSPSFTDRLRDHGAALGETISGKVHQAKEKISGYSHRAMDATSETAHSLGDSIHDAASRSAETVSHAAHQAREKVSEVSSNAWKSTRDAAHQTKESIREKQSEAPLLFGAGALAAGFLTALLLPRTEKENEYCGAAADDYKKKLRQKKDDLVEDAKQKLSDARLDADGLEDRAEESIDSAYNSISEKIDEVTQNS